jgi:hypothetical protein
MTPAGIRNVGAVLLVSALVLRLFLGDQDRGIGKTEARVASVGEVVPTQEQQVADALPMFGAKAELSVPIAPAARSTETVPQESNHEALSESVIDWWLKRAAKDPAGTLDRVLTFEDDAQRRDLLHWILAAWTSEDRNPALEWLALRARSLPQEKAADVFDTLLGSWAVEDALTALDWVERRLDGAAKGHALKAIASTWSVANPETLEAWILSQTNPALLWVEELIQGWIQSDPKKAMEWCQRLPDPKEVAASRQNVIQSWLLTNPEEALAYLRQNPSLIPDVKPVASGSK